MVEGANAGAPPHAPRASVPEPGCAPKSGDHTSFAAPAVVEVLLTNFHRICPLPSNAREAIWSGTLSKVDAAEFQTA